MLRWALAASMAFSRPVWAAPREAAVAAHYQAFKDSWLARQAAWRPPYKPGQKASMLQRAAQAAMADALRSADPTGRAALYQEAEDKIAAAWAELLFDHGSQIAAALDGLRRGLTLDETLGSRLPERDWIFDEIKNSGAGWVRLLIPSDGDDPDFALERSFNEYDAVVSDLARRGLRIIGASRGTTASGRLRMASHYKETIRSWELYGDAEELKAAAADLKAADPGLETIAALMYPPPAWTGLSASSAALAQIDVISLNVEPGPRGLGIDFEPDVQRLAALWPGKKWMFGAVDSESPEALAWSIGASAAIPGSVGGAFWSNTLTDLLPSRRETALYRTFRQALSGPLDKKR